MRRPAVFAVVLTAILGFALLTAHAIAEDGVTFDSVVALLILGFLSVALIGALLGGPRD